MKTNMFNKKNKVLVTIAVACVAIMTSFSLFVCTGCNAANSFKGDIDQVKKAYFTDVTNIAQDIKQTCSSFSDDVKNQDINAMKDKLDQINTAINSFNKINVPQDCQDINKAYLDGCTMLQQALSEYIQIFSDTKDGSVDVNVIKDRFPHVQESYNQGIKLLQDADNKVAEMQK